MNIAQGSLEESRYYLVLSKYLGYGKPNDNLRLMSQLEEVSKLLDAYYNSLLTLNSDMGTGGFYCHIRLPTNILSKPASTNF